MPTAEINETSLFFHDVGTGVPCLVMHGIPDVDHTYLQPGLDPLGDTLRLIYYDQRCTGRSGRPPEETFTFEQLCADADALRHHLGFPRVAVLGHSSGGMVALQYALQYPERLSHLILTNTMPAFNYPEEVLENARLRGAAEAMLSTLRLLFQPLREGDLQRLLRGRVELLPLYFQTFTEDLGPYLFGRTVANPDLMERGLTMMATHDVTSRLGEIRAPTLILTGADDFITPPSRAAVLQRGIRGSESVLLPECGHFPYIEAPEAFFTAIRQWLRG